MTILDIEKNIVLENKQNEFKSRLSRENTISWLKTICGFANNSGGYFYLGVEDKTGKLIGFDYEDLDKEKIFLFNTVEQHFDITPSINTSILKYKIRDKDKYILKVEIKESNIKPIYLKYKGMPMTFMRRDGFTNEATIEEIIYMAKNSASYEYDKQITKFDFKESDFTKLNKFYHDRTSKDLTTKQLASINFFDENNKLFNGSLFFKDDYNLTQTKIVCSYYKGLTRGDNEIISSNEICSNLIDEFNFIWEFIQGRINHGFIKKSTSRVDLISYPDRSLFEAIINALAHRDYSLTGTQISVDIFYNRIVISSPGSLFNTGELKPTNNLSSFISRRRNELISSVFILCKAMEAKGTGFEKIEKDYENADLSHKPYIFSKNNQFTIVLPDLSNPIVIEHTSEMIKINGTIEDPSQYDLNILSFCYQKNKSISEITNHLSLSNSTFFRKKIIDRLVNQKFLTPIDEGNKKTYITNIEKVFLN